MNFKLKKRDRALLVKQLREMDSLTMAPSNIPDIYDLNHIRSAVLNNNGVVKVFLDNNVLSRILNLPVEGRTESRMLKHEEKAVCVLMGFFIYCDLQLIPDISMYESQSTPSPNERVEAETIFRYFDHLPAQIYLDLAQGRVSGVPAAVWRAAVKEVEKNPTTRANIASNPYTGKIDSQKAFSLNLMKAWLISKQTSNFEIALEDLMDWVFTNSISDQNSMFFFLFFTSRDRLGSLIKKVNSTDAEIIIKNINNAAWDLAHLNFFLMAAQKHYKKGIHIFCSRDSLCHELLRVSLSVNGDIEFSQYLKDNFTNRQSALISKLRDRHNNRTNRSEHVNLVVANLENKLTDMEKEIRDYVKTDV